MKNKIFGVVALLLVTVMALSSCSVINSALNFVTGIFKPAVELTDETLNADMLIDFAAGPNPEVLFESDGWSNGDVFNVVWKKHNVIYESNIMRLGITEEKATAWLDDAEVEFNYTAGEARTQNYYHYGDFEVSMKPSANPGTASTFFTCTGPYDTKFVLDENGDFVLDDNGQRVSVQNSHDEIDIEFLGNDTTHVQFNFFVDGVGGNEYMHELGFDASEDFHSYGYRWEPDSITWFVDGVPVYKVTTDTSVEAAKNVRIVEKLPSTPGRILTNYWCGNERAVGWMGLYTGATKDQGTEYQWIKTSAQGAPLNPEEKPDEEMNGIDWSSIEAIAPTFESTELYTVNNEGTNSHITYTEVGGSAYKNVEMNISAASADKNYLHLVVTNNASTDCRFRVNVIDSALVDAGAQNMSTNVSATINGEAAFTDHEWGGSFFDLAPGQTYEIVISFSGSVELLQLMPDSSKNDSSVNAGDITVSEIKFAKVGEIIVPEEPEKPDPDQPKPEVPVSGDLTANINGVEVAIDGNVTDGYGVNANDENNTINVAYNAIKGNSYKNIWINVSSIAATKDTLTLKVTNNGTESVLFRIDVESKTQVNSNTTCCNLSATQDGADAFTDLEWGGSSFTIAAGATATLSVTYDPSKHPTNVKIFVDSSQWDDGSDHAGDVTISEIAFSGEYTPVEPNPDEHEHNYVDGKCECGESDPDYNPNPDTPATDISSQLEWWISDASLYVISGTNIKYNGVGNTYACVGSATVAGLAAGNNTFTVTVTNNGASDSRVRFDIQGTTQIGNHKVCNTGATGGDVSTDFEWGGSTVTVEAGKSVTLVITYDAEGQYGAVTNLVIFVDAARGNGDAYSADITLSNMTFTNVVGE